MPNMISTSRALPGSHRCRPSRFGTRHGLSQTVLFSDLSQNAILHTHLFVFLPFAVGIGVVRILD